MESLYDMTPEQFAAARKKLRHTQQSLAELMEIGERSIKRYEGKSGQVPRIAAMAIRALTIDNLSEGHTSQKVDDSSIQAY